ncbi:MAG TPA: hypothetical protein PK954_02935, partial [Anaerolineales bacterium]|nr:hypothetical protein [Anaerolineales bacterium]
MPDLVALETDLRTSLPPELAVLAPDLARTLQTVALGQVSVEQARFLLSQPTTLAILREMLASQDFITAKEKLPIALGKTIGG